MFGQRLVVDVVGAACEHDSDVCLTWYWKISICKYNAVD
jgi:hypothetical protein